MKKYPLQCYLVILFVLSFGMIFEEKKLGLLGLWSVQLYLFTPAIAAIITRRFFYTQKFSDANLQLGKIGDYFKFWFISICIAAFSYLIFTLIGSVTWDYRGELFINKLAEQFEAAGYDIFGSLPLGIAPMGTLLLLFILGLTIFNIFPGIVMGFGEEFGHLGFMFPLLYKIKPWVGIIIGGIIWYGWQLPLVQVLSQTAQFPLWQSLVNFIVLGIATGATFLYLAYVYIKTRNIWVASLAHITMNSSSTSFSYFAVVQNQFLANIGLVLTMIIVVAVLYWKGEFGVFKEYFGGHHGG